MRITELSDYSMVIMKDSEDPPWYGVGDVYRAAVESGSDIMVVKEGNDHHLKIIRYSSEFIYTAGRLVLFFKDPIDPEFHLHDKVYLINVGLTTKQQ